MTDALIPATSSNITNQYDDHELQPGEPNAEITWPELLDQLRAGGTFWLTTLDRAGRPHTRPVFAVQTSQTLFTASSSTAVKTRALEAGRHISIATTTTGLDIVWAGTPCHISNRDVLEPVVDAYRTAYGWDVAISDNGEALTAPYGAPTAGPPPYEVFRIDPTTVHAIGTDTPFIGRSTRWDFTPNEAAKPQPAT